MQYLSSLPSPTSSTSLTLKLATNIVTMTEGIEVMLAAERPGDPGLEYVRLSSTVNGPSADTKKCGSLVFVHGLLTLGLPELPPTWAATLKALAPINSSIMSYNANLEIHNSFKWKDIQSKTTSLISSLQDQIKRMKVCSSSSMMQRKIVC